MQVDLSESVFKFEMKINGGGGSSRIARSVGVLELGFYNFIFGNLFH